MADYIRIKRDITSPLIISEFKSIQEDTGKSVNDISFDIIHEFCKKRVHERTMRTDVKLGKHTCEVFAFELESIINRFLK